LAKPDHFLTALPTKLDTGRRRVSTLDQLAVT
jgi:hypothetical protein